MVSTCYTCLTYHYNVIYLNQYEIIKDMITVYLLVDVFLLPGKLNSKFYIWYIILLSLLYSIDKISIVSKENIVHLLWQQSLVLWIVINTHPHRYTYIIHTGIHTYIYTYVYGCIYVFKQIRIYIYMCVCVYIYI